MIQSWFQLNTLPFANLPHNQIFQSESFLEGVNRLEYLKQNRGIMLLTGPSGCGKTTLIRYFAASLNSHQFKVFYTPLSTISIVDFYRHLNAVLTERYLYRKSDLFKSIQSGIQDWVQIRKIVPVILLDEAHLFRNEHFQEFQIILNFEYDAICPVILVLIAHPFLRDRLSMDILASFNRRISIKHHLTPQTRQEVQAFIHQTVQFSGGKPDLFSNEAIDTIYQNTSGNTAAVGKLALKSLMAAASFKKTVSLLRRSFMLQKNCNMPDRMEKIFYKLDRFFAGHWLIGILDDTKGCWELKPGTNLIAYLKAMNAHRHHILIKPIDPIEPRCILIDDVRQHHLESQHQYPNGKWRPGRLVIETSPNNFQVWIRTSSSMENMEKCHWLSFYNSDPGAAPKNRWGRFPGFRNTKSKHLNNAGYFPLAKLIWIDWANDEVLPIHDFHSTRGAVCQPLSPPAAIFREDYNRVSDPSATDFAFAMALIRRGASDDEVRQRILEERPDWSNHQGEKRKADYLDRTIQKARALMEF